MVLTIIISDGTEGEHLSAVALAAGLTEEQYATNIVTGWLQSQVRDIYIGGIRRMATSDLVAKLGPLATAKTKGVV